MLKLLRISNFKGWEDTREFSLGPLNTFFGVNSSGKSSIGQFLMLLKQTVDIPDNNMVLYTGDDTSPVNLGAPLNIIYKQKITNRIKFKYEWGLPKKIEITDFHHEKRYSVDSICFSAEIGVGEHSNSFYVESFQYDLFYNGNITMSIGIERVNESSSKRGYKLTANVFELTRFTGRPWNFKNPIKFYGFPDEAIAYYQNTGFLRILTLQHERFFSSLFYLGPLRVKAARIYPWGGVTPDSVGYQGENAVMALIAAEQSSRRYNLKPKGRTFSLQEMVARALKKMELIAAFKVEKIAKSRQEYEVKVQAFGSEEYVDIPDVGFGVSQVLPVIIELFYAPKGAVIVMEQPELHLHPNAQAALADVMIEALLAREDSEQRDIQLLIETHSEHFLRRLQRRVAEESIPSHQVRAYFANNTTKPPVLEPLQVDMFGSISNWPKNFFGDITNDIFQQATHAINRKILAQGEGKNEE